MEISEKKKYSKGFKNGFFEQNKNKPIERITYFEHMIVFASLGNFKVQIKRRFFSIFLVKLSQSKKFDWENRKKSPFYFEDKFEPVIISNFLNL